MEIIKKLFHPAFCMLEMLDSYLRRSMITSGKIMVFKQILCANQIKRAPWRIINEIYEIPWSMKRGRLLLIRDDVHEKLKKIAFFKFFWSNDICIFL